MKCVVKLKLNSSRNSVYEVEIIRSNRKTLTLSVKNSGVLLLKCPNFFSDSDVENLLSKKRVWIDKILNLNKLIVEKYKSVINYKTVLINGLEYELKFCDCNFLKGDVVYVKNIKSLKNVLVENCFDEFKRLCLTLSETCSLSINEISVKSYTKVWATCDNQKNLGFNFRIFMLPTELQKYVIIHELCHTAYMNHSPKFRSLLLKYCPNAKDYERRLLEFSFLTDLYR